MSGRRFLITTSVLFGLSTTSRLLAAEWHVAPPAVGNDANPGTPQLPFATIQRGIDASSDGEAVIVAEGTYLEHVRFKGKNIALTSTDPLDPAVVASTVIDGNQSGRVVLFDGTETAACVLSGFTIQNGDGGIEGHMGLATIQNNVITGNSTRDQGGGLSRCGGLIQNNTITANSALNGGGLLWCWGTIQNNAITRNSTTRYGGGLLSCLGTIQHNTIASNSAGTGGGGLDGCYAAIRNCIIWGNTAPNGPQLGDSNAPSLSCVQGGAQGRGNIASDPRFVDANANDYRLQPGSPCIDAGANGYWLACPQRDRDGNCRLAGTAVDMGCYECGASPDTDGDLLSDADEAGAGTDPLTADTDEDGLRDGLELRRGSNPLAPTAPGILSVPSAVPTVQQALAFCLTGDEIVVAPGIYRENLEFCGPDVILRSANPGDSSTVGTTVIDGGGVGPVVRFTGGETDACVLDGFTIRNGSSALGGGIDGDGSRATIQNNTITGNSQKASWYGTGGGGLYDCDGAIRNNTITRNMAEEAGGGGLAFCDGTIEENTITRNSTGRSGGGLYGCAGTIQKNIIAGNSANMGGFHGGGLCECAGTIQNNMITGNVATDGGGLEYCPGTIRNNTITGNAAGFGGGLADCHGTIQNCIIWGNTAPTGPQLVDSSLPSYCCIEGWSGAGQGNISPASAGFVNATANDYHLQEGSPCIDAGKNEEWMRAALDLDGNLRIVCGAASLTVDMGAYEYGSWPFVIGEIVLQGTGDVELRWRSRPDDLYVVWSCADLAVGVWTQESAVLSGGESTSWTDLNPDGPRRFYRVEMR